MYMYSIFYYFIYNFLHLKKDSSKSVYKGELKPSIDTAIHSNIYKITKGHAIIHIHTDKIFLGYPYIDEQFPCGSMEEKDAIISALKRGSKYLFSENENTQVIQMQKHGLIIVGSDLKTCEDKLDELSLRHPALVGEEKQRIDKADRESRRWGYLLLMHIAFNFSVILKNFAIKY